MFIYMKVFSDVRLRVSHVQKFQIPRRSRKDLT